MDPVPLIPVNERNHDVIHLTTEILHETNCPKYPKNVCENLEEYRPDIRDLAERAATVLKISEETEEKLVDINAVEEEMMRIHGMFLIKTENELKNLEFLQLKRTKFCEDISEHAYQTYGLIKRIEILPHWIEQFLDFTYNPDLHTCKVPCPEIEKEDPPCPVKKTEEKLTIEEVFSKKFALEPKKIVFKNCELNQTYRKKFKLRNITGKAETFSFKNLTKSSPFKLKPLTGSCRLAPGMFAEFSLSYRPAFYQNVQEILIFKTYKGEDTVLNIFSTRDPPKLSCYVFNPKLVKCSVQSTPECDYFSKRRCSALNLTVDCGTCLFGDKNIVTLVMKNEGRKGNFFLTTEHEWFYEALETSYTRTLEVNQGCFTIFPTFFEIDRGEVGEIFVVFEPTKVEFFNEKFILVCDNNTVQQIDVIGDGVAFACSNFKVDLYLKENTFGYTYKRIHMTLPVGGDVSFILTVENDSPVYFDYYWAIKADKNDKSDRKIMDPNWINIVNATKCLPSFSATDFVVQLAPTSEEEATYCTVLSLYVKNIPVQSVSRDLKFMVLGNSDSCSCIDSQLEKIDCSCCSSMSLSDNCYKCFPQASCTCMGSMSASQQCFKCDGVEEEISSSSDDTSERFFTVIDQFAEVHICQLEVECTLKHVPEIKPVSSEAHEEIPRELPPSKMKISRSCLNFGVLPIGVEACKSFWIENLTRKTLDWRIIEMVYQDGLLIIKTGVPNLNRTYGLVEGRQRRKLIYRIHPKQAEQRVSVLVLFSTHNEEFSLDAVSLVVYETSQVNIGIHSETSNLPVLSPKSPLYVGIPTIQKIHVHNFGKVTGCFYFFKPCGNDKDKVRVRFHPQSGVVTPGVCTEVKVELLPMECGILEDVCVPCFTGNSGELNGLKIICVVDCIRVYFYLPDFKGGYKRIMWPPRSEAGFSWGDLISDTGEGSQKEIAGEEEEEEEKSPVVSQNFDSLIEFDCVAATYPTVRIPAIKTRKPYKFTFHMENISPLNGNFEVEAANYGPESECLNNVLVRTKIKSVEKFWEQACLEGHGIVVEPEHLSGDIVGHEVVEISLWIYANTWGTYLEEVIVELNELIPFCFNLIVEVWGNPVEFPFALNTILKEPTLRLGNLSYNLGCVTKKVKIVNSSAIPITLTWHWFDSSAPGRKPFNLVCEVFDETLKLVLTKKFYGEEIANNLDVNPTEVLLERQCSTTLSVVLQCSLFKPLPEPIDLKYKLIGYVHIKDEYRFKGNYFKRKDLEPVSIAVSGTLEIPVLQLDLIRDDTKMDIFVNDLLLRGVKQPETHLRLRNNDRAPIVFSAEIEKPFKLENNELLFQLIRDECIEVTVKCEINQEQLLEFAEFIYKEDGKPRKIVENFVNTITKNLYITQNEGPRQTIPFHLNLHYPEIEVVPDMVKFDSCLLFNTKKFPVTVYNLSGCVVKFEVYKSSMADDFEIIPSYGEILGSTGANKQFMDVMVYFTPREVKNYSETLRIHTNIPQYFIDVILIGDGTNNEKFQVV